MDTYKHHFRRSDIIQYKLYQKLHNYPYQFEYPRRQLDYNNHNLGIYDIQNTLKYTRTQYIYEYTEKGNFTFIISTFSYHTCLINNFFRNRYSERASLSAINIISAFKELHTKCRWKVNCMQPPWIFYFSNLCVWQPLPIFELYNCYRKQGDKLRQ